METLSKPEVPSGIEKGVTIGDLEIRKAEVTESYRDPRQVPLSKPDSAGPGQDRVWQGQVGGSGWGRLHPGGLAAAAAVAPRHRSAASESPPGPAAGKGRGLRVWTGPGSPLDS